MHATTTIPDAAARLAWALRTLEGPHILESGCGDGSLAIGLARAGNQVSGADRRPEAVAAARAALRREDGPVQDRTRFFVIEGPYPFADASFDSVLLGDATLPAAGLEEEVRRVTVASGRIAAWLPADHDPATFDLLIEMFQLEGFDIVDGGIGLEMISTSPLPDTDQPLARAVQDAARALRPAADPALGGAAGRAGDRGEPAEIKALLLSSRADRSRLESLENECDRQVDELARLRSRIAELERREEEIGAAQRDLEDAADSGGRRAEELAGRLEEVEAELAEARERATSAQTETREAQVLVRTQEYQLAEMQAAADGLRSQLAQSAEDARRRQSSRATIQAHLEQARREVLRLKGEVTSHVQRGTELGAELLAARTELGRADGRATAEAARADRTEAQLANARADLGRAEGSAAAHAHAALRWEEQVRAQRADLLGRHAAVESELAMVSADRESMKVRFEGLAAEHAAFCAHAEELRRSRAHRLVTHIWRLSRRRRAVAVKGAASALVLLACLISFALSWGVAAGVLAITAVVTGGVLALEILGLAPRDRSGGRKSRSRA